MTAFERVCGVLNDSAIAHALIGASALAARGVARSTYDIDLLTTDGRVLEPALWQSLSSDSFRIDIRRGDADDPLGGVVRVETARERPRNRIGGRAHFAIAPRGRSTTKLFNFAQCLAARGRRNCHTVANSTVAAYELPCFRTAL